MANYYGSTLGGSGNINNGSGAVGIAQAWVEGTGILGDSEAFKSASLWAGRRYYNRNDVHIMDFFYWNNQGDGFGIENINLGFAKLHYAYTQTDNHNTPPGVPASAILTGQNVLGSHNFRLSDLAVNPGGVLNLGVEFEEAKPYNATSGTSNNNGGTEFIIQHVQSGVLGGDNKFVIQYGNGAAAGNVNSNYAAGGNVSLTSDNKTIRLLDNLFVQPNTSFGMQAVLIYQQSKNPAGDKTTWTSIGGRPTFFMTKHFSVAVELGMDTVKPPVGETLKLTKETLAFVWSPQPNFWSRPQLRAFVTNAQWNDSAQAAGLALAALPGNTNGNNPLGQSAFGTKTSGTTYGVQLEIWW
jgi:maltoporin